jgi:hypothetical protein
VHRHKTKPLHLEANPPDGNPRAPPDAGLGTTGGYPILTHIRAPRIRIPAVPRLVIRPRRIVRRSIRVGRSWWRISVGWWGISVGRSWCWGIRAIRIIIIRIVVRVGRCAEHGPCRESAEPDPHPGARTEGMGGSRCNCQPGCGKDRCPNGQTSSRSSKEIATAHLHLLQFSPSETTFRFRCSGPYLVINRHAASRVPRPEFMWTFNIYQITAIRLVHRGVRPAAAPNHVHSQGLSPRGRVDLPAKINHLRSPSRRPGGLERHQNLNKPRGNMNRPRAPDDFATIRAPNAGVAP